VDPESGLELERNQLGVLEVISPRIGADWIRTSDLASCDQDGCYTLHGRADSALFRGGFKVIPDQVEAVLAAHPAIHAVCIVGVPDSRLGQVPACAYSRKPDQRGLSAEDFEQVLADLVREKMPATHVPVHWRELDSLPLTASFKISRADVMALF
jgi:acyl-CoA synthetase (AMP-forming)/AMP-acid ligase II